MWKHFGPSSYRITRQQQSWLENFIDIGDAFIQNLKKFSRQERDFKDKLDLLLSKKREKEMLEKLRSFEKQREIEKQRAIKKQRDHMEKEKEEKERRDRKEEERKESERAFGEKR